MQKAEAACCAVCKAIHTYAGVFNLVKFAVSHEEEEHIYCIHEDRIIILIFAPADGFED